MNRAGLPLSSPFLNRSAKELNFGSIFTRVMDQTNTSFITFFIHGSFIKSWILPKWSPLEKARFWLRQDHAEKYVRNQERVIRSALVRLARRHSYNHLTGMEQELFEKLQAVPGSRHKVFREAASNVRKQLGQRDFFRNGLMNSNRYLPYMEQEFKTLGLPSELTRIPYVESSFNERAFSKAGASGIWQIMPRTGRAYMIVNPLIDERNSPIKATLMAARMLKEMQHITKSWALTITSYNHGIGNLRVAIRRARSKDLATIIARYHRGDFKFASSNYYTCFLAALHAEKYNELVFNDLAREPLQVQEVVVLKQNTTIQRLQRLTGLSRDQLLTYNLDLKSALALRNSVLPKGYELHIPKGITTTAMLGQPVNRFRQTSI